jgi:hypothetical protein
MRKANWPVWFSGTVVFTGASLGVLAAFLVRWGNPGNMGLCVACFLRDIAGGLGLHRAAAVQYIRPEIIGVVLGAFLAAFLTKEFRPSGGSSPLLRFVLGMFSMTGALVFLGCPVRMALRLSGGDLNAILGLSGFASGIYVGVVFLKRGFTLGRSRSAGKSNGIILPAIMLGLFFLLLARPAFIFFSEKGPGSQYAPVLLSLIAGLLIGGLAQRSRFCLVGGIRDFILIGNPYLFFGLIALIISGILTNIFLGLFHLGFSNQPLAHGAHLWNFLGMMLVGLCGVLLGGCPLRQLILAGEGNCDAAFVVLGMLAGAALAHNFDLASSPKGPTTYGQIAVIALLFLALLTGIKERKEE